MTVTNEPNELGGAYDAVRELAPVIETRAEEIEEGRRLPTDLVDALTDAGCFRMLVPRSHGGAELDLPAQMRVIEELARADGSVGWTVMIGGIAPGASTRDRCAATGRGSIVALGDHRAVVPDLVGMTYVAELVTHPARRSRRWRSRAVGAGAPGRSATRSSTTGPATPTWRGRVS